MRYMIVAALTLVFFASASAVLADGDYKKCAVGDRVEYREGKKVGTVTALGFGGDATSCMVKWAGENDSHLFASFMLRRAGSPITPPAQVKAIELGRYACYGGKDYSFGGMIIQSSTAYVDLQGHPGRYQYDAGSQLISFKSGTYSGTYGKYRHAGEISLSPTPITPNTYFNTVCDLHR